MIRDILVPLQYTDTDAGALDAAAALAVAHEAQVAVLATVTLPMPMVSEWGLAALPPSAADCEAIRGRAREAGETAKRRLERAGAACEVRLAESLLTWPEEVAALHARHADLCVIGGPPPGDRHPRFPVAFSSLLTQSGRPLLMVPDGARLPAAPRRALLAWQPRREAARALHDALALLPAGARVDVLMVDPVPGELQYGQQPGADIAHHLARHGCQAQVLALPSEGREVAAVIAEYARQQGVDLLVMGGYGHARWREQILGGTTRSMLALAGVPVLFAH